MSVLLVFVMYALWSSIFSLGKLALIHSPPLFLTASRMLLAGILILGFLAIKNRFRFHLTGKQLFSLCLLGFLSVYLANAFEFWSLQHLTAAKTCFIYSLSPFFSALFSYLHFKEKMNLRKWVGMLIGFCGILPVLAMQKGAGELISTIPFLSWPELGMVAAALSASYGWILLRVVVKDNEVSPLTASGISMAFGGIIALIHSLLTDTWSPFPVALENIAPFLQGIAVMTLISNIICYNLYGYVLKKFTATFLSFMGLFSPIFASLSSWFFLGEEPSYIIFGSTGIVLIGLWLVYSAELKQGYIRKAKETSPSSAS